MEWQYPPEELSEHVILCNASPQVRHIVKELHAPSVANRPDVVLVLQDVGLWQAHPEWHPPEDSEHTRSHFFVLRCDGGAASTANLRRAGLCTARAAVILADPRQEDLADARSTLVALAIERIRPEVHTVMELTSSTNRAHLEATEVNEVVCSGDLAEKLIAQSCISPGVKNVFANLLTTAGGTCRFFSVPLPRALSGQTYREIVRQAVLARSPFVICGFLQQTASPPAEPGTCAEPPPRDRAAASSATFPPAASSAASPPRRSATAHAGLPTHSLVLNPRGGWSPGRDTRLSEGDLLVLLGHERPDLERSLALASP